MSKGSRTTNEWLADHGGVILIAAGIALIVLAAVYSERLAVAPIFAFSGIASIVFGVLLPRIEGQTEFSTTGIKFVLTAVHTSLRSGRKKPEEISNLLELSLAQIDALLSGTPVGPGGEPKPVPDVGQLSPPALGADLEEKVGTWLAQNGWEPVQDVGSRDGGWDFVARRGDEVVMVQVKASSRIGASDVAAVAVLLDSFALDVPHAVLVVPEGSLSSFALDQARAASDVLSVYEAKNDGTILHVTGPDVIRPRSGG